MNNRLLLGWLLSCLVLLAGWVGGAVGAEPRLEIADPVRRFDTVEEGQEVTASFVLTNSGDAPLQIEGIRPGCRCIRLKGPTQLLPGSSGTLRVWLDTTDMSGERLFKVHIASNDPQHPRERVLLQARIRPLVTLSPDRFFLRGPVGKPLTGEIDIVSRRAEPLKLQLVDPPVNEHLQVRLDTITPGKHLRLSLRCTGSAKEPLRERLLLDTNIPGRERIAVPVLVDLQTAVELLPGTLSLRNGRCPACLSALDGSFLVRATNNRPLILEAVEPKQAGLEYQISTLVPEQAYRVRVQWQASAAHKPLPSALAVKVRQDKPQTLWLPLDRAQSRKPAARGMVSAKKTPLSQRP